MSKIQMWTDVILISTFYACFVGVDVLSICLSIRAHSSQNLLIYFFFFLNTHTHKYICLGTYTFNITACLQHLEALKTENQRLKDENGALIRVISKLSK